MLLNIQRHRRKACLMVFIISLGTCSLFTVYIKMFGLKKLGSKIFYIKFELEGSEFHGWSFMILQFGSKVHGVQHMNYN